MFLFNKIFLKKSLKSLNIELFGKSPKKMHLASNYGILHTSLSGLSMFRSGLYFPMKNGDFLLSDKLKYYFI